MLMTGKTSSSRTSSKKTTWLVVQERFLSVYTSTAMNPMYDTALLVLLLVLELALSIVIVNAVPYTEIDWRAYMQEVETWLIDGEYDYRNIRGDTGPLVYPAGFLYLFAVLRTATSSGTDILTGQYIFIAFYIAMQCAVLLLYQHIIQDIRQRYDNERSVVVETSSRKNNNENNNNKDDDKSAMLLLRQQKSHEIWIWRTAMCCVCCSKRIHSIFLLRLFNDGPCMLLLYCAVTMFMRHQWRAGCVVFSLAVSIKMNVLLFAPGLLLLLLQVSPDFLSCCQHIVVYCGFPQLVLGAPFLSTYPISYVRKSFELDRVFFYEWTVNLKFLPESVFVSKPLSVLLLMIHLSTLSFMAFRWIRAARKERQQQAFLRHETTNKDDLVLTPSYIAYTMFVSNFVGIAFARTLHYQFYVWYFHSIPVLLCMNMNLLQSKHDSSWPLDVMRPVVTLAGIMLLMEYSFLTFPATPVSSGLLQAAHLVVLMNIQPPRSIFAAKMQRQQRQNQQQHEDVAAAADMQGQQARAKKTS